MPTTRIAHHTELDRRLVEATRGIGVLGTISWPTSVEFDFIAAWRVGRLKLPQVDYPRTDLSAMRATLDDIARAADPTHPLGDYIRRTAESWRIAAELLEAAGTPAVTAHSARLYGRPGDRVPGGSLTNLDAARHFIAIADEFHNGGLRDEAAAEITADTLRDELQPQLDAFFGAGVIKVETDADLIAKAAAGATRIRLRSATYFSDYDRHQLLAHEAFVHSLTALNGRAQPRLKSLARASPRTTATQEGLAVFAELMSGSIDISRMKRISLRILAIDMAINGADFIEVFRFFIGPALMWDLWCALALEGWRERAGKAAFGWFRALAELEAAADEQLPDADAPPPPPSDPVPRAGPEPLRAGPKGTPEPTRPGLR